jgi:hypothetical protein
VKTVVTKFSDSQVSALRLKYVDTLYRRLTSECESFGKSLAGEHALNGAELLAELHKYSDPSWYPPEQYRLVSDLLERAEGIVKCMRVMYEQSQLEVDIEF